MTFSASLIAIHLLRTRGYRGMPGDGGWEEGPSLCNPGGDHGIRAGDRDIENSNGIMPIPENTSLKDTN